MYTIANIRNYFQVFGISFLLIMSGLVAAAEPEPIAPPLIPIPLSDIPTRASAERLTIDQIELALEQTEVISKTEQDLLILERVIDAELTTLTPSLSTASSRDAISEIERKWLELDRSLEDSESDLRKRTNRIQQQMARLHITLSIWELTVKEAKDEKAPADLIKHASDTAENIANLHKQLLQMQNRVLALQAKVGRTRSRVQSALDKVKSEEASLLSNLTRRERPPLWSEAIKGMSFTDLITKTQLEFSKWWSSIKSVIKNEYERFGFQIFILIILTIVISRSAKIAHAWSEADPSIAKGISVFDKPLAISTLLVLMMTPWIYASTSPALTDTVNLLLVFPVMALVMPLLNKNIRPALAFFAIIYVIDQLRDLLEAAPLVARLLFIVEMVAAIAIIIWVMRAGFWKTDKESNWTKGEQNIINIALNGAVIILIISALATITGYVRLAVLIGSGVLNSIYLALLLAALLRTAESIIKLVLHSRAAAASNLLKTRTKVLSIRLNKLLATISIITWLLITLDLFVLLDPLVIIIKGILFAKFNAGAIAISLADVLAFIITITIAIMLARFIVLILDEDVYPRIELKRGVSFAISSVIKYSIILTGFVLAVGAMGIGMDRITILLGAFGVGLGFGLQSIVNNFVSGMILIFERPVQIGDSVEIGSVKGNITRVGIRSSTVRSFEGADITIPNGTLLSDALTNWTMTDRKRRLEIAVGVAYGTNPDIVIEALHSALEQQDGILSDPAPQVVFSGFGDSSLDFLLRAWVGDNDKFVSIKSKVALAMNRALNERGIEIPFPQRDLHLRSIAPDVNIPGNT